MCWLAIYDRQVLHLFRGMHDDSRFSSKRIIRGGIRTRDLLLRRQTRYPLRYTDTLQGRVGLDRYEISLSLSDSA